MKTKKNSFGAKAQPNLRFLIWLKSAIFYVVIAIPFYGGVPPVFKIRCYAIDSFLEDDKEQAGGNLNFA